MVHMVLAHRSITDNRTNTIILAASALAGGLLVTLILLRIFWNCCRRGSGAIPLPPVQPLAHVREQRLAQFAEYNSPAESPLLPTPTGFLSGSRVGSKTSLLQKESSTSSIPSRSICPTAEVFTGESAIPLHPFQDASPTSSSENAATNLSINSPAISHTTDFLNPDRGRSIFRPPMRPRPASMTSVASTMASRGSSTIRGVPHSPHSNVKIIMPMPLASTLHPHMNIHSARRHASINGQGYDPLSRLSVVDKWASSVRSPDSSDQGSRSHSLEPQTLNSQYTSPPHRAQRRSVTSSPPIAGTPSTFSPRSQSAHTPPVPQIPSMYNNYTPPELDGSALHSLQLQEEIDLSGRLSVLVASRSSRSRPRKRKQIAVG